MESTSDKPQIGDPHDLILKALNQSEIALNGKYSAEVKVFASFLRDVLGEKQIKNDLTVENPSYFKLILGLRKTFRFNYQKDFSNFKQQTENKALEYEQRHSQATYNEFLEFLKQGIYYHILCQEEKGYTLFSSSQIDRFATLLGNEENETKISLSALKLFIENNNVIPQSLLAEYTTLKDQNLLESAIFLSYVLSRNYPNFKRELLFIHYLLIQRATAGFTNVGTQTNISDDLLERLFRIAIILHYCGYSKSLRIPHEEKILYLKDFAQLTPIEQSFKTAYRKASSMNVPKTTLRFPAWALLVVNLFLIPLHWLVEVYLPLDVGQLGFQYTIPNVPLFLTIDFIITIILLLKFMKLEQAIVKILRRG